MTQPFHWLDVQRIAEELADRHPGVDPLTVKFVALREMVQALPGFKEQPGHQVNERILEEIQSRWVEEREDSPVDEDEDE